MNVADTENGSGGPGAGSAPDFGAPGDGTIDVWGLLRGMWGRKRSVIVIVGAVMTLTVVALMVISPKFAAENRLIIESRATAYTNADNQRVPPPADTSGVQSEVEVLMSRDLASRVIAALKLEDSDEYTWKPGFVARVWIALGLRSAPDPERGEQRLITEFIKGLTVYQVSTSRVVAVNYLSKDPDLSANVANRLAQEYIAATREAKFEDTERAIKWLDRQIVSLREKVVEAEGAVENFRANAGLLRGPSATLNSQQLSEFNSQIIRAATVRAEAQAQAGALRKILARKGGLESAAALVNSPQIQRLADQKVLLRRQVADLSVTFLPSHPRMQRLNGEVAAVNDQMRTEAMKAVRSFEDKTRVAQAREKSLRESLESLKTEASKVNQDEVKLRALEREAKSARDSLESLLKRYRDASARAGLEAQPAGARIISHASAATAPAFPKAGPTLLLAFVAAFIVALMYVFLREIYALNTVAAVGAPAPVRPRESAALSSHGKTFWDDMLRNSKDRRQDHGNRLEPEITDTIGAVDALDVILSAGKVRRIVISAATVLDSDCAAQLAIQLARHNANEGWKTLLIDSDFHQPGLAEAFDLDAGQNGLAELLAGHVSFGAVVSRDLASSADVVTSGGDLAEATGLIDGRRMDMILDGFSQAYDLLIVLGPDILTGVAGPAMARRSDLVVLIAESDGADWRDNAAEAVRALNRPGQIVFGWDGTKFDVGAYVPGGHSLLPA